jgi:hypothetical protein
LWVYGAVVLLFLARLSFAAEESPTCGDGDEITLSVDVEGVEYNWSLDEGAQYDGVEIVAIDGPRITVRCPPCPSAHDGDRFDAMVEVLDADGNRTWAYTYFRLSCPDEPDDGCRSGGAWIVVLGLAFRRRRP